MYLPYLRGKQFELIALREFSIINKNNNNITPIIEPVKATYNSLNSAIKTLWENNLNFALILNPKEGDFKKDHPNILDSLNYLLECKELWIPAFILMTTNCDEIMSSITNYDLDNVMIICKENIDINNDNILKLLEHKKVSYIVYSATNSRSVDKKIRSFNKKLIRLDNKFNSQKKNADYLNIQEELFTEEFKYFREDGYYGFSDYTVLPKEFIDGGMLPYAIAIHLSYKKVEEEVWVRHFVSDSNNTNSNIQGKFFEAAVKAKHFFLDKEKTPAINELLKVIEEEKYPGLGVIKKISIRNHIELINHLLSI